MLELHIKTGCRKDIKRAQKRGKDMQKFWIIVRKLQESIPLEPRHRPHRLTGIWYPFMECHIEPDWLLVYNYEEDGLWLIATGTHSDLFD